MQLITRQSGADLTAWGAYRRSNNSLRLAGTANAKARGQCFAIQATSEPPSGARDGLTFPLLLQTV